MLPIFMFKRSRSIRINTGVDIAYYICLAGNRGIGTNIGVGNSNYYLFFRGAVQVKGQTLDWTMLPIFIFMGSKSIQINIGEGSTNYIYFVWK